MKFNFETPPPVVEQEKDRKRVPYTIREVSFEEILAFRRAEEVRIQALAMRDSLRSQRIADFETQSGVKLDNAGLKSRSIAEKIADAQAERIELARAENAVVKHPPWEPIPEPRKTIWQRVTGFFTQLWKNANFS